MRAWRGINRSYEPGDTHRCDDDCLGSSPAIISGH